MIFSFKTLVVPLVCGSLVSCSLFQPKAEEDSWGDPNWEIGDDQTSESSSFPGYEPAPTRRSVASSSEVDYWPSTEELERRGGRLTPEVAIAQYDRKARAALHGLEDPHPMIPADPIDDSDSFPSLVEPTLPTASTGSAAATDDPLEGFWDEQDYSDNTIKKAGDDSPNIGEEASDIVLADSNDEVIEDPADATATATATASVSATDIVAPIPPSPAPMNRTVVVGNTGGTISKNAPTKPSSPSGSTSTPNVIPLDADGLPSVSKEELTFEGVSMLKNGESIREKQPDSLLEPRRRLSLSDLTPESDEPLLSPSIGNP